MTTQHAEVTRFSDSELAARLVVVAAKRGRRPKGERKQVSVRFPVTYCDAYEAIAESLGMPLTDYVARVMALYHDQELTDYMRPRTE